MNPETEAHLKLLGFVCMGRDPEALDHYLFNLGLIEISVPSAGSTAEDITRYIYQAGKRMARREVRSRYQDLIQALTQV